MTLLGCGLLLSYRSEFSGNRLQRFGGNVLTLGGAILLLAFPWPK
jgi:hypothetical protein